MFEAGLGQDMSCWEKVVRPLAAHARLILYTDLEFGRSGPRIGSGALLASTVAGQLGLLLSGIDAPGPYILVGHSLGGFYIQAFARITRRTLRQSR